MISENYIRKVQFFIQTNSLLRENSRVIVGLSGGPDSVCLAIMLQRLGFCVTAMHCNFHLRGDESMRDEKFVEDFCKRHNIELFKIDFNTTEYAKQQKISIEMAARDLRYDAFRNLRTRVNADAIAVGHHKDDNIETLLLNLTRGTGIKGLCGMQPKNDDIIRPLLCLSRDEIMSFLNDEGESYVVDHTNMEDEYSRNKVRLDIMPLLMEINEGVKGNLSATMENLNEVRKVYDRAISDSIRQCCDKKDNGVMTVNITSLISAVSPISILHELLFPLGFNKSQLKDILNSINDCGKFFEAKGNRVLVDRNELVVEPSGTKRLISHNCADNGIVVKMFSIEELKLVKDCKYAYLDADKVKSELSVRFPETGDSFAPFGMNGKRKLVSDFLTDLKLNRFEKEKQLLVCDGEEIVWVAGRRSSDLYKIDANTKSVIMLYQDTSQQ